MINMLLILVNVIMMQMWKWKINEIWAIDFSSSKIYLGLYFTITSWNTFQFAIINLQYFQTPHILIRSSSVSFRLLGAPLLRQLRCFAMFAVTTGFFLTVVALHLFVSSFIVLGKMTKRHGQECMPGWKPVSARDPWAVPFSNLSSVQLLYFYFDFKARIYQ